MPVVAISFLLLGQQVPQSVVAKDETTTTVISVIKDEAPITTIPIEDVLAAVLVKSPIPQTLDQPTLPKSNPKPTHQRKTQAARQKFKEK